MTQRRPDDDTNLDTREEVQPATDLDAGTERDADHAPKDDSLPDRGQDQQSAHSAPTQSLDVNARDRHDGLTKDEGQGGDGYVVLGKISEPPATATPAPRRRVEQRKEIIAGMVTFREQFRRHIGELATQEAFGGSPIWSHALHAFCATLDRPPNKPRILLSTNPDWPWPWTPPSQTDKFGLGPWPGLTPRSGSTDEFAQDMGIPGFDYPLAWSHLPELKREEYRMRSETRRQEAWTEFEKGLARRTALRATLQPWGEEGVQQQAGGSGSSTSPDLSRKKMAEFDTRFDTPLVPVSGFELFRDELEPGLGLREVLRRWEALTDEEREPYDARAREANTTAFRDDPRAVKKQQ